jgi:polyhydroxyalkanoate synthesis regulator phasin
MMMKQLIQKAKSKFFEPDEVSGSMVRRIASPLEGAMLNRPSAEQQRIQHLENQIQQLRADVARWKKSSLCLAHEVRDLLAD